MKTTQRMHKSVVTRRRSEMAINSDFLGGFFSACGLFSDGAAYRTNRRDILADGDDNFGHWIDPADK